MRYLLLLLILSSCGPAYHLKKAKKHLLLAEAKGAKITTDTVYKTIPVITKTHVYDTVVIRETLTDTLVITNTKYSVKLKYDTITKKEYVQVICKQDTVFVKVPVKIEKEIKPGFQIPTGFWWVLIFFLIAYFGLKIFEAYKK